MKYAADLHIHSALSPCASNDMTPNNIVNMAYLNKLEIIAVTDHNTVENLPAVESCARERGILIVPGMELETSEEIHILCYLPTLDKAFELQKHVFNALPGLRNRVDIFGDQLIMDSEDRITGICEQMLVTACRLSLQEVFELTGKLGGVAVPAHINRSSYSILANLGYIPEDLGVTSIELDLSSIKPNQEYEPFLNKAQFQNTGLYKYNVIHSSDSHSLDKIFLAEEILASICTTNNTIYNPQKKFNLEIPDKSTHSVIQYLRKYCENNVR